MKIEDIQGWFTWSWLYDYAAAHCGQRNRVPTFVEVGVWKGRSIAYLCQQLLKVRGPGNFALYGVDTWGMEPTGLENGPLDSHLDALRAANTTLYDEFTANMQALGLGPYIHPLRRPSVRAAADFDHVDFVFIDGDHRAEAVAVDVEAWRPKAALLCGHDWSQVSVRRGLQQAGGVYYPLALLNCWTTSRVLAEHWDAAAHVEAARLLEELRPKLDSLKGRTAACQN